MKTITQILLFILLNTFSNAQTVAFQADRMNVLYIGVDNPITIVAENTDCDNLKIYAHNVTLTGKNCKFIARVNEVGTARITVTYKINGKVKNTLCEFKVRRLPLPNFMIWDGKRKMSLEVLKSQEYVRAQLEGFEYNLGFIVDSFTVCAFSEDTCVFKEVKNIGNKISDKVKKLFSTLKPGDTINFKNIYAKRPDEDVIYLEPVMIKVY